MGKSAKTLAFFVLDTTLFRDELTIVYLGLLVHSRVLWKAAHQKVLLDELWLQTLLGAHRQAACTCSTTVGQTNPRH